MLLDSCRPDYLNDLDRENQYDWVGSKDTLYTPTSSSIEWINKCLEEVPANQKEGLAIVSGNDWTERKLDASEYHSIETLLDTHWDEDLGIPPEAVTNHAIQHWRENDPDQMIVWYVQPHTPYPHFDVNYEFETEMEHVTDDWTEISYTRVGAVSDERLREVCRDTIEFILEEVGVLTENLDAETVYLSADHAEILGEWGLYEHPRWAPIPRLECVPWVKLVTRDEGTREPELIEQTESESELDERLEALGYKV